MKIADRYEPTGNATWGGMAEVHECIDTHLTRKTMLKRVKKTGDARRLIDEQKALLKLRSRHVVQLLDIVSYDYLGETESGLILEFIDGNNLAEGSQVYGLEYLKTLWQIASGLCDIHEEGIIHRDIKPDNIRLDSAGVVKIIDFGLAREVNVDNKTRSIIGTPGFMAPELRGTKTIGFTAAIDMYAFGCTAIALLTATSNMTPGDKSYGLDAAGADPQLKALLLQCLNDHPTSRPTAGQVRDTLAKKLVLNRHRARLIHGASVVQLDSSQTSATITAPPGSVRITYTGEEFVCDLVSGQVFANNNTLLNGSSIGSSCVIILGTYGTPGREFVPFDLSRPEVMI